MTAVEAVLQLIKEEPSIETLLGRFKQPDTLADTVYPMVLIGTFPETQTNLPAISIRRLASEVQYGVGVENITVSCYAETENDSENLANAVNEFFRDSQGGVDGFSARFESSITGTVNDSDTSGAIVGLRVIYR